MSNRDGMAQSAGKPTLPPGRAAGATLVQPTVRLGVKSAGLLPLQEPASLIMATDKLDQPSPVPLAGLLFGGPCPLRWLPAGTRRMPRRDQAGSAGELFFLGRP